MIKRTLVFGQPAYLSHQHNQLVVKYPNSKDEKTVAVEDVGFVVLEDPQITISGRLLSALAQNNAVVICCNEKHFPAGMMLPFEGHTELNQRYRLQLESSVPLRKNLWQQIVKQKITNQATVLKSRDLPFENMLHWSGEVTSGDTKNHEGRAAAHYWGQLGTKWPGFTRERSGVPPNGWLNYGYALIRAAIARSVVSAGLLPAIGLHHQNKYNAFCMADDLMEPFRPYTDALVMQLVEKHGLTEELKPEVKKELLQVLANDVLIDGEKSPLMIATSRVASSLVECFEGSNRKLLLPDMYV